MSAVIIQKSAVIIKRTAVRIQNITTFVFFSVELNVVKYHKSRLNLKLFGLLSSFQYLAMTLY